MSASSTFIPSRSPARGGSSSSSVRAPSSRSSYASFMPGEMARREFWMYLLLGVVAFALLFFIVRERNQSVHAWARVPCWLGNPFVLSVIVLLVVALAAYSTAVAHTRSETSWAAGVGGVYVLILGLVAGIAWLVYRAHSFTAAFYISILAVVLSVVHFSMVWRVSKVVALLVVPLVLFLLTVLYYLWTMADESTDCASCCSSVYAVAYNNAVAP